MPAPAESVLQLLHDSEINAELASFHDCGFWWKLGDRLNGYLAEGHGKPLDEAVSQIILAAILHNPHSAFARSVVANAP